MTLKLLCNPLTLKETTNVEVKVINNLIRKDLDLFSWTNEATKLFGDFDIYSDHTLELNCFDQCLSLLVGREIKFAEGTVESYATYKCTDYLFQHFLDKTLTKDDVEYLALKFTNYLLEVSFIFLHAEETQKKKYLGDLFLKYFPEYKPMTWNKNIQNYSSNNA